VKWKAFAISVLAAMMLAACGGEESTKEETSAQTVEAADIKQLVHNYSAGNTEGETASITSQELIVQDSSQNELLYELPEDEFFVSIAPYINETHP
jgi:ABC-type glycerol-3-phosphate transport system substrate-binding protein